MREWACHLLCVVALMWTGIVNGQAFFFPDSTNYIRAADAAVYLVSGKTFSTVWTDRYRAAIPPAGAVAPARPAAPHAHGSTANDVSTGLIMSGRSPYIGALMYLGYLLGDFWPFILFQAVVAYLLVIMALRRFGVGGLRDIVAVSLALALVTALPTYNSLLLADAFAGFGLLAFLLVAMPGRLTRPELGFLCGVIAISVTAHLTHVMMMIGMVGMLALLRLATRVRPPARAWWIGIGAILLGVAAVQVTAFATRVAFGREPQLLPLLTARFYMDGPGRAFVDAGCEGRRFQVCRIAIDRPSSNSGWLFNATREKGAYMLATPEERRRMGEEDTAFALAVLRHDPIGQTAAIARNTLRQLVWIDYDSLNQGCFDRPDCWDALPGPVRDDMKASLSGRNAWPRDAMNALLYVAIIGALASLPFTLRRLARADPAAMRGVGLWLWLGGAAMLVNSFFGGAVADPQYRYQGRLAWLVMLIALIALLRALRPGAAEARR